MKRLTILLLMLVTVGAAAWAELRFKSLAVTDVSQTYRIPAPAADVQICNWGANEAFFRVFLSNETPAAATNAYSELPAGSATAPYCFSTSKPPTAASYIQAVSIICTTAETATVTVQSW